MKCKFGTQTVDAIEKKWDEVQCPIPPAVGGPDFFGNVPFEATVNGDEWHSFTGGF